MWKWAIGLTLLGTLTISGVALAFTTEEVTISATGANVTACEAPANLTATMVSEYEYELTWVQGSGNITIIRGAYGRFPVDETDGFEIFNGNGTSTTYFVNTEFLGQDIGIRAWSDCGSGSVSTDYSQTTILGRADLVFFALIILCLGLTAVSIKSSFRPYMIGASAGWIGLMGYTFVYPPGDITAGGPVQAILAICFIAMAVIVPIMSLGREVQSQETMDGFTTGSKQWRLPKLQMREKSEDEKTTEARDNRSALQRQEDYRKRVRRKLGRDDK